jgi:hypothetical protein
MVMQWIEALINVCALAGFIAVAEGWLKDHSKDHLAG